MKLTEAKTILVTFLMQLGDIVLTTPFITALRRAAPQAKIVYLMDSKWLDILEANPDIDEILTIERKGQDDNITALWNYSRKLKKRHFDLLINLNPSERCTFLAAFSGASYKAGASPVVFRPWFDKFLRLDRKKHAADMYVDTLRELGAETLSHDGLKVIPAKAHEEEAARFLAACDIQPGDKVIGFNIGSASPAKCWYPDRFAQVADKLADEGYKILFLGSLVEMTLVDAAIRHMKNKPLIATGKFRIGVLVPVIRRLNLLVTNDSGPMHIAVSQKTPIVALFGPSHPELYGPYNVADATVIVAEPFCAGCKKRMKHRPDDMSCMENISANRVYAAAHALLAKDKKDKMP